MRYWASYGRSGFLGAFASSDSFARGDRVIVQSPRGLELATVLEQFDDRFGSAIEPSGTIDRRACERETCDEANWLEKAAAAASDLPVLIADIEALLDGTLILHVMPWGEIDLSDWVSGLAKQWDRTVQVLDLSTLPREKLDPTNCGKPDCGGGGCGDCGSGCSTGSCSKGSVKSAAELTDYFAGLRKQLEAKRTTLA